MNILITGGAGYIGSHVVKALSSSTKYDLTIYDNLSTGHKEAVSAGKLVIGDLADLQFLEEIFRQKKFDAVLNFAGSIKVPESVSNPLKYYFNNTVNTFHLLNLCSKYQVKKFIFSSTAATYGIPEGGLCREDSPLLPINPYGHSKLMSEQMLKDLAASSDLKFVILRYFNVAGADPECKIGQSFPEPFHLINVASEAAAGKRSKVDIYGIDYPTPDGTCIRDYIHVSDLADAHVKALKYLEQGGRSDVLNCGYSKGFSVKEVIAQVKAVTGVDFNVVETERRSGDPASLIAQADRIRNVLNWIPRFNDLNFIIKTAYEWEKNRLY